jgi:hypothetical protein
LAALGAWFHKLFAAWAHGWLAATERRVVSVSSCTASALATDIGSAEGGVLLAADTSALLWAPRNSLTQLGRACVMEGDKLLGDTRMDDVLAALGRSALGELAGSLAELPASQQLSEVGMDALAQGEFGVDGVQVKLQMGAAEISLYLSRSILSRWLTALQPSSQRLRAVKLPAYLGKTPFKVTAWSRPFGMPVTDFFGLVQGDIITMDQGLDTAFEFRIQDHPELTLKSYPGRSGQSLAVEVFEN